MLERAAQRLGGGGEAGEHLALLRNMAFERIPEIDLGLDSVQDMVRPRGCT